ncbi:MAG: cupin domain-containing protein, partial [Lachnospiraceae bacterium]|nr:cupin domain-containing protein [Lachnospiraceae bacterium]
MKKNLSTSYDDRQYMTSGDYELYYYRDTEAVKRTGLHTHPYYEFYFFLEGNAEAQVQKEHYILSYGDIFIVPPNTTHGVFIKNFDVPYRRFDLWISVPFYERLVAICPDLTYFTDAARKENRHLIHTEKTSFNLILNRLYSIIEEKQSLRFGRDTRILLLISDLGLTVNRLAYEQFNRHPAVQDSLYRSVCAYIDNNIDSDLSLDVIAGHFFLSKYYLSHVFKNNIGISIHQ